MASMGSDNENRTPIPVRQSENYILKAIAEALYRQAHTSLSSSCHSYFIFVPAPPFPSPHTYSHISYVPAMNFESSLLPLL